MINLSGGWIKLRRQLQDSWVWQNDEPFSYGQAWVDLILLANHTDTTAKFDGDLVMIYRGQHLTSVRKLSERWQWSKDKTGRFLKLLAADNMIIKDSNNKRTLITIINYDDFQNCQDTERTQNGHRQATNKNNKNDKKNIYGGKSKLSKEIKNKFNNFHQRDYDFQNIEQQLIENNKNRGDSDVD